MASTPNLYNAQFMDHVQHPDYKYKLDDATHVQEGINPSCGDQLTFYVKLSEDRVIEDASYEGQGCAISQASADMMSDIIIDKSADEAIELCKLFAKMLRGEVEDESTLDALGDASLLKDISHMPARVKCAELAWHTLEEMLQENTREAKATVEFDHE